MPQRRLLLLYTVRTNDTLPWSKLREEVRLSQCLSNWGLREEEMCGSGCIRPLFLTSALDGVEWSVSRPGPLSRRYPPRIRPQCLSGRCGVEKTLAFAGNRLHVNRQILISIIIIVILIGQSRIPWQFILFSSSFLCTEWRTDEWTERTVSAQRRFANKPQT
jgi:hypothetical protein